MYAVVKVKHLLFMLCTAGVLILLMIIFFSYGWFINNKTVSGDRTAMKATESDFELGAVDSSGAFDTYLTAEDGNLLSDITTSLSDVISPVSTGGGKNTIKWLMSGTSNFNNYSGENVPQGIQPGDSGKLSFYVIAKRDTALDINFSLDTVLYTAAAQPISADNTDNSDCIIPNDQPEADLVKGHILFFKEYDEVTKLYSGMITDGTFNFSEPDAKAGTAYRVDIYWIWPDVADQLILPENDSSFAGKEYGKIISDADTAEFKAELVSHPEKYFADTGFDISNISGIIDNVSKGTASTDFNYDYYSTLNGSWNAADQLIGKKVGFIELQLSNIDT